jgi:hypothetical protein
VRCRGVSRGLIIAVSAPSWLPFLHYHFFTCFINSLDDDTRYLWPSLRVIRMFSSTAMAVVGGRILVFPGVKGDWYQTLSKHHSHNLTARSAHLVLGTPNVEFSLQRRLQH